jgi:hypothetical protein
MKLALLFLASISAVFAAFPNGYTRRVPITIAASQITGTLTDFTWPVNGTYADLKHTGAGGYMTSTNGYDHVYTESDGSTAIPYCPKVYDNSNGRIVDNLKPAASAVGTVVYLYFGNAAVTTDQSNCTATWRSTFKEVWPLGNGSTLSGASPVTGGHTMTGVNSPTAGAGQIDGAAVFNGTTQSMRTSAFTLSTTPMVMSFSAWVKITSMAVRNNIFTTAVDGTAGMWWMEIGSGGTYSNCLCIAIPGQFVFAAAGQYPTDGAWHHVAFTRNGTGNTGALYIDGVSKTITYTAGDFVDSASKIRALGERQSSQYLGGSIESARWADSPHTAAEIAAEHKSGISASFYSFGTREDNVSRKRSTTVN